MGSQEHKKIGGQKVWLFACLHFNKVLVTTKSRPIWFLFQSPKEKESSQRQKGKNLKQIVIITLLTLLPNSWKFTFSPNKRWNKTKNYASFWWTEKTYSCIGYPHCHSTFSVILYRLPLRFILSPVSLSDWIISVIQSTLNSCGEYSYSSFIIWSALIPLYSSLKCDTLNNSQHVFTSFGKRRHISSVHLHAISP